MRSPTDSYQLPYSIGTVAAGSNMKLGNAHRYPQGIVLCVEAHGWQLLTLSGYIY